MHIKELRLDGFKSFGEPTAVPFYEGFTTISGPNGSGKSNLIDGVLFALGLARTRGMRARKQTDLLYNPPGDDVAREASVEVVLDNTDRAVTEDEIRTACGEAEDPDEIVIRRRIKKTESDYYSYYYIDDRSVNLSDVQDLLANAGVTPEGYNVVMQGDVTGIINMGPTERRGIIEEIAGTAEFDDKREQAEDELQTVQERIERQEPVLEQLAERLERLETERERALEYKQLKSERDEQEGHLAAAELVEVERDIRRVERKIERKRETRAERREEFDEAVDVVEQRKKELQRINEEISKKGEDDLIELKGERERLLAEISGHEDRIEDVEQDLEEIEQERREKYVQADGWREDLEDKQKEVREAKVTKSSLKSTLQSKRDELEGVRDRIQEVEGEYSEVREEIDEAKRELEEIREDKSELQREKDRLTDEARRRSREIDEVDTEIDESRDDLEEARQERTEIESSLERKRDNVEELVEVRDDLKNEKRGLRDELSELEEELKAKQEEYAQAEARSGGGSNYHRAVSEALNSGIDGVHGTVADLGSAPREYSTALETAAGGRMANVVVDDDEVGQMCIEHLKRRRAGRATFLPLTEMHERRLDPSKLERDGVVDYAYNLVEFDPTYSGVFSYVFGDTLVVEDLETARSMMGECRLVTVDGDLVERSGAMTGGSKKENRYSFGSKGAVQRLADRIQELETERRDLKSQIEDVDDRLEDVAERLDDARSELDRYQGRYDRLGERVEELESRIETREERLDEIEGERSETREEMEEVDGKLEDLREREREVSSRLEELKGDIEGSEIRELTDEAEELEDEIRSLESDLGDADKRLEELDLEEQYLEKQIQGAEDRIEELDSKRDDKEAKVSELEGAIDEAREEIDEIDGRIQEVEEQLGDLKEERDEAERAVDDAVEARDEARRALERVDDALEELRGERSDLKSKADDLREDVPGGEVDEDEVPEYDEVRREIDRLEREMDRLEPVNMLAIEEYDEVRERREDLVDRKETLEEEREAILERIEEVEERKHEEFMSAFHAINDHFETVFAELSDGSGRLVLDDPEEPFESGMTIKAQPADKPVERLEAMSGGERSLTALSFVFAIQRHTPAPFYFFDEVDESLDAVNVEKVAEMIDDISDSTQFVVISHRSNMVERADRIVGVTMQRDNLSTVTGVKANNGGDAEGHAAAD